VREVSKLVSEVATIVKRTREIRDTLSPAVAPILAATHRTAKEEV
jgi:hypothetical protein